MVLSVVVVHVSSHSSLARKLEPSGSQTHSGLNPSLIVLFQEAWEVRGISRAPLSPHSHYPNTKVIECYLMKAE